MRKGLAVLTVTLLVGMTLSAYGDLQNVRVGGVIEIRGRWYHNAFESPGPVPQLRIAPDLIPGRATGQPGVLSLFRYSDWGNDWSFAEQATSLNVAADFTNDVTAFIEFYSFDTWGSDFRSDYVTGLDARANTADDIEVLQGYIEMRNVMDQPLRLRIGRQVLQFGRDLNCFLLAGKTTPTQRFAYDGIRATYTPTEKLSIDAWWMKLAENSPLEQDGDVDFYGLWATYKACDEFNVSGYALWIRDARKVNDTNNTFVWEWIEDWAGYDDYDVTNLTTLGTEMWGKTGGLDYRLNFAYQMGEASRMGSRFKLPVPFMNGFLYGDDEAEYDGLWGGDLTVGYTFESKWNIRPYLQGVYFDGEDNRDVSFWEYLNPLRKPEASVSFSRLFSDVNYCPVINDNADMSNFWQVGGGVTMTPTEKLWASVRAYNTWVVDPFDWPAYINVTARRWWIPTGRMVIAPFLPFWDKESDDNLGFSLDTILKYSYSKDLTFFLYYGHLFAGDGLRDGAYMNGYGTIMNGGLDKKDADYVFWWAILNF